LATPSSARPVGEKPSRRPTRVLVSGHLISGGVRGRSGKGSSGAAPFLDDVDPELAEELKRELDGRGQRALADTILDLRLVEPRRCMGGAALEVGAWLRCGLVGGCVALPNFLGSGRPADPAPACRAFRPKAFELVRVFACDWLCGLSRAITCGVPPIDELLYALPLEPEGEPPPLCLRLDLVGLGEAAGLLGIGRAALAERRRRHEIPLPVAELRCGPVWFRAQIEHYELTEAWLGRRGWYGRRLRPRTSRRVAPSRAGCLTRPQWQSRRTPTRSSPSVSAVTTQYLSSDRRISHASEFAKAGLGSRARLDELVDDQEALLAHFKISSLSARVVDLVALEWKADPNLRRLAGEEARAASSALDIGGDIDVELVDFLCRRVFLVRHHERHGAARNGGVRERDLAGDDLDVDG
jgi:hypothetical protein